MNQKLYDRLRLDAKREYEDKIRSIDMVWKMSQVGTAKGASLRGRKGDVTDIIRGFLPTLKGQNFTLREVAALAEEQTPEPPKRSSISSALRRLQEDGTLKIVTEGKGKRATVYRVG